MTSLYQFTTRWTITSFTSNAICRKRVGSFKSFGDKIMLMYQFIFFRLYHHLIYIVCIFFYIVRFCICRFMQNFSHYILQHLFCIKVLLGTSVPLCPTLWDIMISSYPFIYSDCSNFFIA